MSKRQVPLGRSWLRRYLRDRLQVTVSLNTDDDEWQQICDEIAIIDTGKLIASGAPTQLVADSTECKNLEELFLALTGKQLRD